MCVLYISLCKTCVKQGHNLDKFSKSPLDIPNIKALGLEVSGKKTFLCFPIYRPKI